MAKKKVPKSVYRHPDKPGAGAVKRKKLESDQKFGAVMGEFKRGTLRMGGSGKHVPASRSDIARAIAMSESGKKFTRRGKKKHKGDTFNIRSA